MASELGAVVLGARDVGGAIIDRLLAENWRVAGIARNPQTLDRVRDRGALPLRADLRDPAGIGAALRTAAVEFGRLDLVVNATTPARPVPGEPPGGGPVADAELAGFQRWTGAMAEAAFVFLTESVRVLRASGPGGCLIQLVNGVAGGSWPGEDGLLAAGYGAVRALVRTAAAELRAEGIRACLLAVDAPVDSPRTAPLLVSNGLPSDAAVGLAEVAEAVAFLAGQGRRGTCQELTLTSLGWTGARQSA
ncbi:MAG TPA: SDR family oxidoreductase [Pseudonocardiaceae bacterium]|nr:SDR family oxidoreductase [Pseudonocardiaceae bacterium]